MTQACTPVRRCRNGHELTPDNVLCNGFGRKECAVCKRAAVARVRAKNRALGPCHECGKRLCISKRYLCYKCIVIPGIRERYPLPGKGQGVDRPATGGDLAPTTAAPGSEEWFAVMQARAAAEEPLHHPDDCLSIVAVPVASEDCGPVHGFRRPKVYRVVRSREKRSDY